MHSRGMASGWSEPPQERGCPGDSGSALPSPAPGPDACIPASPRLRGASALLCLVRSAQTAGAKTGCGWARPARAPSRSSQLPQPIRGQRRLRRRLGRAQRGEARRTSARARWCWKMRVPTPARSSASRARRPPAKRRTRPGRQSPLQPPASPRPCPSRRGGGGLGFKDTLTQAASGLASQSRGSGVERERLAPPSPAPLPLSARPPRAGRKSLGRGRLPEKPVPLPLSLVRLLLEDAQTLHAASLAGERSECSRRHTPSQTPALPGDRRAGASLASLLFKARPAVPGRYSDEHRGA